MKSLAGCLLLLVSACGQLLPMDAAEENGPTRALSAVESDGSVPEGRVAPLQADAGPSLPFADDGDAGSAPVSPDASSPDAAPAIDAGCTLLVHTDGLGHPFASCAPIGAWDEALAWAACRAYVKGDPGGFCQLRTGGTCAGKAIVSLGMIGRSQTNGSWDFAGPAPGHVATFPNAAPLGCPTASSGTWE